MAKDDATDGNTAQWDKLKAARGEREGEDPPKAKIEVIGLSTKDDVPSSTEQPRDEAGKFTKEEKVEAKPEITPPPPIGEEVEIDGLKVTIDPALAAAFKKSEEIKTTNAKTDDRRTLKEELRDELRKELAASLPPPVAEPTVKDLEEELKSLKRPDSKLLIAEVDEWDKQNEVYENERLRIVKEMAKREFAAENAARAQVTAKSAEENARGILREQFYNNYGVLREHSDIVDIMLGEQFDNIIKSGKLAKPMTPAEAEALKASEFADVASRATKRLVKLMHGGKTVAPPVAPPPNLVSSASAKTERPPEKTEQKPKDKYPSGSMSAVLAARRAKFDTLNPR